MAGNPVAGIFPILGLGVTVLAAKAVIDEAQQLSKDKGKNKSKRIVATKTIPQNVINNFLK